MPASRLEARPTRHPRGRASGASSRLSSARSPRGRHAIRLRPAMSLTAWLNSLIRGERWSSFHRLAIGLSQICVFSLCIIAAFLLRFEFVIPSVHRKHLFWALLICIPVKLIVFRLLNLDHGWWRFVSTYDLVRLAFGNFLGSVLGAVAILLLAPAGYPRSLFILDLL